MFVTKNLVFAISYTFVRDLFDDLCEEDLCEDDLCEEDLCEDDEEEFDLRVLFVRFV